MFYIKNGAGDEGRTRDIQLGRLTLYQLSYSRNFWWRGKDSNQRPSGYEPDELPDCSTPRYVFCFKVVPGAGIEPARSKRSQDFKSCASTYSATQAYVNYFGDRM